MRVLITGHSGFVGRHLAAHLQHCGATVFGLSSDGAEEQDFEVFSVDLLDLPALQEVLRHCRAEAVVHLAGRSHVGDSWEHPGDHLRVNFGGTRNLLQALAGEGRILFASSAEVYGIVPEEEQPIGEDRALDPRSPYAMTKACSEILARDHGAAIVRSFNVVGPGQSRHFALPSFAHQLAAIAAGEQEAVLRVGDLSPRRDFLHIADAVEGYRVILEHGEAGQVYNLASGEAVSIRRVLERLMALAGVEAEIRPVPSRMRPVDMPLLCGDAQRLRELGWQPRYRLDDALEALWREVLRQQEEGVTK